MTIYITKIKKKKRNVDKDIPLHTCAYFVPKILSPASPKPGRI